MLDATFDESSYYVGKCKLWREISFRALAARFKLVTLLTVRALRSRSFRDGSLPHKGRFATFVRSYWTLQKITHKYVKPVTSKLHVLN